MEIDIINRIFMTRKSNTFLEFKFRIKTPNSYFSVSRSCCYIRSIFRKMNS